MALQAKRPKDVADITFPQLTCSTAEKISVHFSAGFLQKKTLSIPASSGFFIRKTDHGDIENIALDACW
jgi:hypothetical protein